MSNLAVAIYVLLPLEGNIRYIGKTTMLDARFRSHCKSKPWVIDVMVLEWTDEINWVQREQYWIARFRLDGYDVMNRTAGGQGTHGLEFSAERRAQISTFQNDPDFKAKMSASMVAALSSPHMREKWSRAASKRATPEYRDKMRQAMLGSSSYQEKVGRQIGTTHSRGFMGMSHSRKGEHQSNETRARISAGLLAYHVARKADKCSLLAKKGRPCGLPSRDNEPPTNVISSCR